MRSDGEARAAERPRVPAPADILRQQIGFNRGARKGCGCGSRIFVIALARGDDWRVARGMGTSRGAAANENGGLWPQRIRQFGSGGGVTACGGIAAGRRWMGLRRRDGTVAGGRAPVAVTYREQIASSGGRSSDHRAQRVVNGLRVRYGFLTAGFAQGELHCRTIRA